MEQLDLLGFQVQPVQLDLLELKDKWDSLEQREILVIPELVGLLARLAPLVIPVLLELQASQDLRVQ